MQARISFSHITRWLGVFLASVLMTLSSVMLAHGNASKSFVFQPGDGVKEFTDSVDVSAHFEKSIVVKEMKKKDLTLIADALSGVMSDSKPYCVGKNYSGKVQLVVTGDNVKGQGFQLQRENGTETIPLKVLIKDEKKSNSALEEVKNGQALEVSTLGRADNKSSCDETTTLLSVEADPGDITESGTYKTRLHLRFVAL